MEVELIPGEEFYLTLKLANGSGWLTSHRLILCEHEPGQLEEQKPEICLLKDFKEAQINSQTLIAHFKGKKTRKNPTPNQLALLTPRNQRIHRTSKPKPQNNWHPKSVRRKPKS